jgi:hypothetical protein
VAGAAGHGRVRPAARSSGTFPDSTGSGTAGPAAERADRRYAYDAAVSLLEQALDASARGSGTASERAEQHAGLLGRLLRAQIRAGRIAAARATRQRAADAAGRDDLVSAAFAAWTEPTPWQTRPYGVVDEHAVTILERQLERTDLDQVTRCRLLAALVAELAGEEDLRPARAAAEAEAIARRLGDPDLLALALTAGTTVVNYEREPERRAVLAAEIGQIGHEHGLPEYEWYAEYIAGTAAAVLGQPEELQRRLKTGQRLADEYRMAEPQAVQLCADAMLAHVEGRFEEARRRYSEGAATPTRPDFFRSVFATFRAMAAIAVGDRAAAEALVTDLTPVAGMLAGAASTALAMQPVAQTLGELSAFLGRPEAAARHFATAEQVARRWNSPHWTARARAAARQCPPNG